MAAMQHKTITIDTKLRKRIDKFKKENWSAIACRAFEVRVEQLESMSTTTDEMQATITRLRSSKESATGQLYQNGKKAGARYAMKDAEWLDLERLDKQVDQDGDWRLGDDLTLDAVLNLSEDPGDLSQTYRHNYGDDVDNSVWVRGFIDGALDRYNEVKPALT